MEELAPAEYGAIRHLVPAHDVAGHMAFVHAVIDGSMPGVVWVDDRATPRWAIACNLSGFWFALGTAPAVLRAEELAPVLARRPPDEPTGLWAVTESWRTALLPLFAASATREEYTFDAGARRVVPELAHGFELRSIDAAIARQFGGGTDPWVVKIWGGPEEFARRAFGLAILYEGVLASFCTVCALGPDREPEAEIEIGTAPEFRGRGLAVVAGNAFIEECLKRHVRPAWTCASENVASARTAARLGFRPLRTVTGFTIADHPRIEAGRWLGLSGGEAPDPTA